MLALLVVDVKAISRHELVRAKNSTDKSVPTVFEFVKGEKFQGPSFLQRDLGRF